MGMMIWKGNKIRVSLLMLCARMALKHMSTDVDKNCNLSRMPCDKLKIIFAITSISALESGSIMIFKPICIYCPPL
jgi:hypothetical protein